MRARKTHFKGSNDFSQSRDKSPKTRLFNELTQLVNIYTPLGIQSTKKRNNLGNNSFLGGKRVFTESEEIYQRMGNGV